jgi:hypothetical protein
MNAVNFVNMVTNITGETSVTLVTGVNWASNIEGGRGAGGIKIGFARILRPVKGCFFIFFLYLHHPNNPLENISVFYLRLFNPVAKKNS